jgi:hypothetical protein
MRLVSRRSRGAIGGMGAAILTGAVSLARPPAWAGAAGGMPLVLPAQSLPSLCQLNGSTSFTVVCYSQAPVSNTGAVAQTAVVDLSPPGGSLGPGGSLSLFMFPQDVPVVQQLNGGMQIKPAGLFPSGSSGTPTQVAQVNVTEPGSMQNGKGSTGMLLVCPVPSLPLLGQLNPGLSFNVLCSSQAGKGKAGPGAQTALLNVQPTQGSVDPSQPLPMWVPVDTLPALGQLNGGASIGVIDTTEIPVGGSTAMLPVAFVEIQQNPQAPLLPNNKQSGPSAGSQTAPSKDQGDDSGDNDGKGHGKGQGKGKGKGHHQKGDDQGDD